MQQFALARFKQGLTRDREQYRSGRKQGTCLEQVGERNIRTQHRDASAPDRKRIADREQAQFVPFAGQARAQYAPGIGGSVRRFGLD